MDNKPSKEDVVESSDDDDDENKHAEPASKSADKVVLSQEDENSNLEPVGSDVGETVEPNAVEMDEEDERKTDSQERGSRNSQGLLTRMRKNITSKTMGTRLGRKTISLFIGEGGVQLLHHFKAVAIADKGEAYAKQLKRRVLRTAVKVKALLERNVLKLDQFRRLNKLSLTILRALETALKGVEAGKDLATVDVESLSEMFSQLTVEMVTLYRPHFTVKNVQKLKETMNYWGGRHFLELFLGDTRMKEDRVGSIAAIQKMFDEEEQQKRRTSLAAKAKAVDGSRSASDVETTKPTQNNE